MRCWNPRGGGNSFDEGRLERFAEAAGQDEAVSFAAVKRPELFRDIERIGALLEDLNLGFHFGEAFFGAQGLLRFC